MTARVNGRLVYDSDRAAARVGRRSAGDFARTLLFRSDALAVDVVVHAGADELRLFHGQVVEERSGTPVCEAQVSLAGDAKVETDDFGQFSLSALAGDGRDVICVRTSGQELVCAIPPAGSDG